jgi:hypothetical protein
MFRFEINSRDFGNENIDWITSDDIEKLDDHNKISNVMKLVHYNRSHLENFNIRKSDEGEHEEFLEIRENGKWVKKESKIFIPKIEDNIRKIIKLKYFFPNKELEVKDQLKLFLKT